MPEPTHRDVHIDRPLTDISVAYMNKAEDYIAGKMFPIIPVQKQSDKYWTYGKHAWFRDEAKKRAPGTESAGGGYDVDTSTFLCEEVAFHKDVPIEVQENQDQPLDALSDGTIFVTDKVLLHREKEFVDSFFTSGVWGVDYTGVASAPGAQQFLQWDAAAANPAADVARMKQRVARVTGKTPNTMLCSPLVIEALKQCPAVLDRIKYTQTGIVTEDLLAALFGLKRVLVAKAIISSDAQGAASVSYDYIFGRSILLCHVADSPGVMLPSAGYTFTWRKYGSEVAVWKMWDQKVRSTRIEASMYYDIKQVASDLGLFGTTAISTGFAS